MPDDLYERCKALPVVNGYVFSGIDDGCPFFFKRVGNSGGGLEMILLPEDIELKNFTYMAQNNLGRIDDVVKKFQAKWRKQERKRVTA